jgi:hypothetical protein
VRTAFALAIDVPEPSCWVADCLVCELYGNATTAFTAGQLAAEHDDAEHHGEPTATVHRA